MTVRTVATTRIPARSTRFSAQEGTTPWCAVIVLAAAAVGLALVGYLALQLWHLVA